MKRRVSHPTLYTRDFLPTEFSVDYVVLALQIVDETKTIQGIIVFSQPPRLVLWNRSPGIQGVYLASHTGSFYIQPPVTDDTHTTPTEGNVFAPTGMGTLVGVSTNKQCQLYLLEHMTKQDVLLPEIKSWVSVVVDRTYPNVPFNILAMW